MCLTTVYVSSYLCMCSCGICNLRCNVSASTLSRMKGRVEGVEMGWWVMEADRWRVKLPGEPPRSRSPSCVRGCGCDTLTDVALRRVDLYHTDTDLSLTDTDVAGKTS